LESTELPQGLDPCIARRVARIIANNPELGELPANERQSAVAEIVAAEQDRHVKLRSLVSELEANRDVLVKGRREVEQRWAEDMGYYEGDTRTLPTKEYSAETQSSVEVTPKINLTRSRTNTIAARIGDTLFPSDDRNWDMDPEDEEVEVTPSQPQPPMGTAAMPGAPPTGEEQAPEDNTKADQQSGMQRACERMRARCDSQMRAAGARPQDGGPRLHSWDWGYQRSVQRQASQEAV
jgi:hypothetical protein